MTTIKCLTMNSNGYSLYYSVKKTKKKWNGVKGCVLISKGRLFSFLNHCCYI